jgi:acetylornithine deacetylase/succinyl-diaminopimelate desuccinylase-like protein
MAVTDYLRTHRERHLAELFDWLRIPSISAKSEHRNDTRRAAEWLVERMLEAGLQTAEAIPTAGPPIVIGEWRGRPRGRAHAAGVRATTTCSRPSRWTSGLSAPVSSPSCATADLRARLGGRQGAGVPAPQGGAGAHRENGSLPVNVVFVVEGEEEVGSPTLGTSSGEPRAAPCDAVMISDTTMFAARAPLITGAAGLAYMEVRVQGPATDLHSGAYGGAVVNPANALAQIIARLHDEQGPRHHPGFYDRVRELSEEQRAPSRQLPFDEERLREEVGAPAGRRGGARRAGAHGPAPRWTSTACSPATRRGREDGAPRARHGQGVHAPGAPTRTTASRAHLRDHVQHAGARGVTVEVEALHGGQPWYAEPRGADLRAAARALERGVRQPPVFIREGGSIPIVQAFQQTFGAPSC